MEGVYSLPEIQQRVVPVIKKHGISELYVFGSYARGEASPDSDVDMLIKCPVPLSLFRLEGIRQDLEAAVEKAVDVITVDSLRTQVKGRGEYLDRERELFCKRVERERVKLYEENGFTVSEPYYQVL